jgi:hypothetical protein
VIPFNISCGHCWMCRSGLQSQCETTQVRDHGTGGALFGYTKLYGQVPGGGPPLGRLDRAGRPGPLWVPVANQTLGGELLTAKITECMNAGPCRFSLACWCAFSSGSGFLALTTGR